MGVPHPSDEAIVRGLRSGEAWAATAMWQRHAPMVYGIIDRALGSTHDTEDLTQEVFWRVFVGIRRLRDPAALPSFIYVAAIRMLRWHLRTKRFRRLFLISPSGDLPDAPARDADPEGRELLERLYHLLDRLRADDRVVYVLRHVEGLRLEEIADVTGASLATVKRRIARATKQVAALVKNDPDLGPYFVERGGPDARK